MVYLFLEEGDEAGEVVLVLPAISLQVALDHQVACLAHLSLFPEGGEGGVTHASRWPQEMQHSLNILGIFISAVFLWLEESQNSDHQLQDLSNKQSAIK